MNRSFRVLVHNKTEKTKKKNHTQKDEKSINKKQGLKCGWAGTIMSSALFQPIFTVIVFFFNS